MRPVIRALAAVAFSGAFLMAASANLFGGEIVLTGVDAGAEGQITATPGSLTGGSVTFGSCIGNCVLGGAASYDGLSIPWSLTAGPFAYTLTSEFGGTLSGATGSFLAMDLAGDRLSGTVTLSSFTQDGSGDAVFFGTDVYTVTLGTSLISTEFGAALTSQGFSLTGGTGGVMIGEGSCGTLCLTTTDPTGSATEIVVTSSSVTAPEPATIGLLGAGLAALALAHGRRSRQGKYS
jgi:hypothetical protein